jgi:hypothetical protein
MWRMREMESNKRDIENVVRVRKMLYYVSTTDNSINVDRVS